MRGAVNAVCRWANTSAVAVPLDIARLRKIIETVQPANVRQSTRTISNYRSLFTCALIEAGVEIDPLRLDVPLLPEWTRLRSALDAHQANALARFMQDCSRRGIEPSDVTDAVIAAFSERLSKHSLILQPQKRVQNLVRDWNQIRLNHPGLSLVALKPVRTRQIISLPIERFPEGFRADLDAWCARLAGSGALDESSFRPLRPTSVASRRAQLIRCASVLVHQGAEIESIDRLALLVERNRIKTILMWFLSRNGNKASDQSHAIASALLPVARYWAQLERKDLEQIERWAVKCRVKSGGMTDKNRGLLRTFDDETLVSAFQKLPKRLMDDALKPKQIDVRNANRAAYALAISILSGIPLRIENVLQIRLGKHLIDQRRRGRGDVHLAFEPDEVKNNRKIGAPLSPETIHLLDRYLNLAHPVLCPTGSDFLFPDLSGDRRSKTALGMAISKVTQRYLGQKITPHQFRHLAGFLYLKECPGDYETVRSLLGHKSIQTTIDFYAGMETDAAAQRYDEVVRQKKRGRR